MASTAPRVLLSDEALGIKALSVKALDVGSVVTITGDEFHHLKNVIRKKRGDTIEVVDPRSGMAFLGTISGFEDNTCHIRLKEKLASKPLSRTTLFAAITKPKTCDFVVEKAVEIGVKEIVFFNSTHTQTPIKTADEKDRRLTRLKRIANSAIKQSGSRESPLLSIKFSMKDALSNRHASGERLEVPGTLKTLALVLVPPSVPATPHILKYYQDLSGGGGTHLERSFENVESYLVVGPEGGFTSEEVALAQEHGFSVASLGRKTLRSETAAILACAIAGMLSDVG